MPPERLADVFAYWGAVHAQARRNTRERGRQVAIGSSLIVAVLGLLIATAVWHSAILRGVIVAASAAVAWLFFVFLWQHFRTPAQMHDALTKEVEELRSEVTTLKRDRGRIKAMGAGLPHWFGYLTLSEHSLIAFLHCDSAPTDMKLLCRIENPDGQCTLASEGPGPSGPRTKHWIYPDWFPPAPSLKTGMYTLAIESAPHGLVHTEVLASGRFYVDLTPRG